MSLPNPAPKSPARIYDECFVPALFRPCAEVVVRVAGLEPGQRLLDLACGTGIVARVAAPLLGPRGSVVALDLRPGMLEVARSHAPPPGAPIEWRQGDAVALDLPDACFERVLCQQGLQFFEDRAAALAQIRRVLVPGGRLVLAAWQGPEAHEFFRAMAEIELRHLTSIGATADDVDRPFSLGDGTLLVHAVESAGFSQVSLTAEAFEANFPADGLVRTLGFGYSAVVPEFASDPERYESFVSAVERECSSLVERHRRGDRVVIPMRTHIVTAVR